MATIEELVQKNATLENAIEWNNTMDKFVFCIDIDGISANWRYVDFYVVDLEMKFEEILKKNGIPLKD